MIPYFLGQPDRLMLIDNVDRRVAYTAVVFSLGRLRI
jgi:hypothetical protein